MVAPGGAIGFLQPGDGHGPRYGCSTYLFVTMLEFWPWLLFGRCFARNATGYTAGVGPHSTGIRGGKGFDTVCVYYLARRTGPFSWYRRLWRCSHHGHDVLTLAYPTEGPPDACDGPTRLPPEAEGSDGSLLGSRLRDCRSTSRPWMVAARLSKAAATNRCRRAGPRRTLQRALKLVPQQAPAVFRPTAGAARQRGGHRRRACQHDAVAADSGPSPPPFS